MAKTDQAEQKAEKDQEIDFFGADREEHAQSKTSEVQFHGGTFVDAEVPRNVRKPDGTIEEVMVRKPAPRYLAAKSTTMKEDDQTIATLTARYKMAREGFRFAPDDDKALWERRMLIALEEMKKERMTRRLARYQARPNPRPDQVAAYEYYIWECQRKLNILYGQDR